jgi:glutamate dehydrogenase (NAD(P)+)
MRGGHLIAAMENVSQKQVPDWMREEIVKGAAELDLVRSGLDDTMRHAYQELREVLHSNPKVTDHRTAAYVVAISKIARSYFDLGTY